MSKYPTVPLPTATIADLAWLAGIWRGEKNDDPIEEHWSAPACGAMMGMFRWLHDERVRFYEFLSIEPESGGLLLRIKHFHPGLIGWEEKEESVVFTLVQWDGTSAVFVKQGTTDPLWMVYRRTDENNVTAFFEREEETPRPEDEFRYTRSA